MPLYAYEALDPDAASAVTGVISADTPRQARRQLRQRGLSIERIEPQLTKGAARSIGLRSTFLGRRRSAETARVNSFIRELSTLLGVGVPLLESIDTIARQHARARGVGLGQGRRRRFHSALLLLRDRVAAGTSLAEAMRDHPGYFDDLCVHLTEVGEDTGTLDTALERLARFRERARQLKGKLGTALIYPAIVVVMAIGISVFLMTFVVPSILQPLIEMNRPLPLPTRLVKGASDALVAWGWLAALAVVLAAVGLGWLARTARGRRFFDGTILRLPVLGELVRKQAIVRIAVVIGALLRSGIVFVRALQVAAGTTSNVVLKDALLRCEKAIAAGSDIGQALEDTAAFPPLVVQIFSVGQQSGRLEEMLERLAEDYDQDVATSSQRLAAILEPLLIILLAVMVLLIAMATMLPILEAGDVLQ